MESEFKQLLIDLGVDIPVTLARLSNNDTLLERVILKFTNQNQLPQLEAAVEKEDYQTAEMIAHTVKGVSGNLGLTALYQACDCFVQDIRKDKYDQAKKNVSQLKEEYTRVFGLITTYQRR